MSLSSFITYRSCKHLDNKHTVFGKLVGGMETLSAMERVNTDNKDRPIEDVVIERAAVFVDPFAEVDEQVGMDFKSFYLFGSLLLDNKKKCIMQIN